MNVLDLILLALIVIGVILAFHKVFRNRRKGGCSCGCSSCSAPCSTKRSSKSTESTD